MTPTPTTSSSMPKEVEPGIPVHAVVVVHDSPPERVDRCLRALVDGGGLGRIVIVDNGATPVAPPDLVGADLRVVRVGNDGYGAAVNRGVDALVAADDGECFVAVVNDDVVVEAGWVAPLHTALYADPALGAAQPKLLLEGSDPVALNSVGVELDGAGAGVDIGYGLPDGDEWASPRRIEIFTAGAVLLRSSFLRDVGGFDERYFLYYEDVDLALRGAERGWRYRCEPSSVVWHRPGSSTDALGGRRRYLQERNRLWVAARFGSPRRCAAALWLSVRRLRHRPRQVHLRALLAGLGGWPRALRSRWARSR